MTEGIVSGLGHVKSQLIFDEEEFSIQRRIGEFVLVGLAFCLLFLVIILSVCYSYQSPMYLRYTFIGLGIVFFLCFLYATIRIRSKNLRVYKYSDLKAVKVKQVGNNFVQLYFSFADGFSDSVKTRVNIDFLRFEQLLHGKIDFKSIGDINNLEHLSLKSPEVRVIKLLQEVRFELQYDDRYFWFECNTSSFWLAFLYLPMLFILSSKQLNVVSILLSLITLGFLVYCVCKFIKYKRVTNAAFGYSDVTKVEVEVDKRKCSRVTIYFKNGATKKIRTFDQPKLQMFLNVLEANKVTVINR